MRNQNREESIETTDSFKVGYNPDTENLTFTRGKGEFITSDTYEYLEDMR